MSRYCPVLVGLVSTFTVSTLNAQELPRHAMAMLGDYRFHHGSSIELVAMSPDGLYVASLARKPIYYRQVTAQDREPFDRTIVLWDAKTGQRIREMQAPAMGV